MRRVILQIRVRRKPEQTCFNTPRAAVLQPMGVNCEYQIWFMTVVMINFQLPLVAPTQRHELLCAG